MIRTRDGFADFLAHEGSVNFKCVHKIIDNMQIFDIQ